MLRLFVYELSTARSEYSRFVRSGIERGRRPDLTGGGLLQSHGGWTDIKALRETGDSIKAMIGYWATEKLGTSQSRLAHLLKQTQSAITYAVQREKAIVEANSYLIE
ncbi:MAG: hypothetical protein QUS13_02960 [Smithella sp.]|nr:hypothetical protein [Smithella sp.]HQI73713.1 hypothetical protein [Smithella sp.]